MIGKYELNNLCNEDCGELVSTVKVGSLFDGIGGTPLSAVRAGAEPVWASEIEKWPISITKRHFPNMKHLGDITQINGAEIEPVDIIVGGSPCQDLSVAGKREGLGGERSGLFMDQCRIVKEMRNAARQQAGNGSAKLPRPRYMVWENVPGAFSSNKGEDFRAVLEEIARIADPEASIPRPPKGKWLRSGTIMGDGYSVAWRTVDAQYWGVPQRRRRIYLVADFGGSSAPEICFEREGVSGNFETSGEAGQGVAGNVEGGSGEASVVGVDCYNHAMTGDISATLTAESGSSATHSGPQVMTYLKTYLQGEASELCLNDQGGSVMSVSYGKVGTLRAQEHGHQPIVLEPSVSKVYGFEPGIAKREGNPNRFTENLCPTLRAKMGDNQAAVAYSLQGDMIGRADHNGPQGSGVNEDVSFTLNTADRHAVCYGFASRQQSMTVTEDCVNPILSTDYKEPQVVCYGISSYHSNSMKSSNPHSGVYEADTSRTIDQNGGNPACNQGGIAVAHTYSTQSYSKVKESEQGASLRASGGAYGGGSENYVVHQAVRRLTPLECERLQGYPDGWTQFDDDGKEISDTQRYKALGNSFAVPNAYFFISRCVQTLNGILDDWEEEE